MDPRGFKVACLYWNGYFTSWYYVLTIAAGAGKSFLTCDSFHDFLNDRSIAIEYLRKRWQVGIPVFFYFNSKEHEKQPPNMVLACLLRQLATLTNRIHPRLKIAYDSKIRPQRSDLIDIFKAYRDDFSLNIFVMLDAFDECHADNYGDIISIIQKFMESEIRVYVTTRDHLSNTYLCNEFKVSPLEIKAHDDDVKNFVMLELEKPKTRSITPKLKQAIIDGVTDGVNGM